MFEKMQQYFSAISEYIYFDKIISLGSTCKTAYQLNRLGFRSESYPFDWLFSKSPEKLIYAIENDFEDWCLLDNLEEGESTTNRKKVIDTKYSMIYQHHFPKDKTLEESYEEVYRTISKRVNRFLELKNSSQTILFVRSDHTNEKSALEIGKAISGYGKGGFLLVINLVKNFSSDFKVRLIAPNIVMTEIYDEDEGDGYWEGYDPHWDRLFERIKLRSFNVDLKDNSLFEGFYLCEKDWNGLFRWLSQESLLHLEKFGGHMCELEFASNFDIALKICNIRNEIIDTIFIKPFEENKYIFRIDHETRLLRFIPDRVWRPCDYSDTSDDRLLSVRLKKIYVYD